MSVRSASFRASDLVGVLAVGRFRCRGCYLDIYVSEPVNPERPTQGPLKCERCGDLPIIVNQPREAAS
mgnify:CR=1 FL=1